MWLCYVLWICLCVCSCLASNIVYFKYAVFKFLKNTKAISFFNRIKVLYHNRLSTYLDSSRFLKKMRLKIHYPVRLKLLTQTHHHLCLQNCPMIPNLTPVISTTHLQWFSPHLVEHHLKNLKKDKTWSKNKTDRKRSY